MLCYSAVSSHQKIIQRWHLRLWHLNDEELLQIRKDRGCLESYGHKHEISRMDPWFQFLWSCANCSPLFPICSVWTSAMFNSSWTCCTLDFICSVLTKRKTHRSLILITMSQYFQCFFFFFFFRLHSKQMRSRMCLVEQGVTELPNSAVNKVIPTLIYIYLKCFFFFTVEVWWSILTG